jgi:hypothetical protein
MKLVKQRIVNTFEKTKEENLAELEQKDCHTDFLNMEMENVEDECD